MNSEVSVEYPNEAGHRNQRTAGSEAEEESEQGMTLRSTVVQCIAYANTAEALRTYFRT